MKKKVVTVNVELKKNSEFKRLLFKIFRNVLRKTKRFRRGLIITLLVPIVLVVLLVTMFYNKYKYNDVKVVGFKNVDKPIIKTEESQIKPITEVKKADIQKEERPRQEIASRSETIRENAYQESISDKELLCRCVESEAGNQPFEGKIAVANVILNRVASERFPDTIRGVIYAQGQFQVVRNGAINRAIPSESTIQAVEEALNGTHIVPTNVTYFATPNNNFSGWATPYTTIGGHKFWIGK